MEFDLSLIVNSLPLLLKGAGLTLEITALAVGLGLIIGLFLGLAQLSKNPIFRWPAKVYVDVIRGTPLLMQLFFLYYTLPQLVPAFNIQSRFLAAWIAFSLNVAAYLAEIIRAAIQSIDKGQLEASTALGLTHSQAMRLVIIPQAYRRMIPPICNEFVMVLKDTSLVSIIALTDLTYQTKIIASNKASALVYIPAMIIYLIITGVFTVIFNRLEKRLSIYE